MAAFTTDPQSGEFRAPATAHFVIDATLRDFFRNTSKIGSFAKGASHNALHVKI
ncbi:hypothetical protein [Aquibium oceanicum]|uniref:hypothetical protein n=1 Tax=Aquibium oceanicum TaxID=1670800 RepID=UPI000A757826